MAKSVILETMCGTVICELYWNESPKACENFYELARRGYYNGVLFHRLVEEFILQGGDPTGTGRGGSSIFSGGFEDELHPNLKFTGAGILAMANSGPNSNTSQFFISLAPTPSLNGKHTIFGRVLAGMGVVERLGSVAVDADDRPKEAIKIIKCKVVDM